MVQKVVINVCFGGFGLSQEAVEWMRENYDDIEEQTTLPGEYYSDGSGPCQSWHDSYGRGIPRDHEALIAVIKNSDISHNGRHSELRIVEVPDGVNWVIDEYDGQECVEEKHRSWR